MTSRFISVDDHVVETPDLWTSRLSSQKWGERIPRLVNLKDGRQQWVADGEVLMDGVVARTGAFMNDRNVEVGRWEEVPEAAWNPAERLKVMDKAGIGYSVLYPSVAGRAGEAFARLKDRDLEIECVRAYNDWILEEWAGASDRFVPQCIAPIWPPENTVAEIERCVKKGHKGVIFPALPMELRDVPHVSEPEYDRVWAACQSMGVPLCLHSGASPSLQNEGWAGLDPRLAAALDDVTRPVSSVYVLGLYLFSRILMRHPNLKVVMAESALSWGMLYLEWADHQFEHDGLHKEGYEHTPSELFRRQCFLTGWYDRVAPFLPFLGGDSILWSASLPNADSSWPETSSIIERALSDVPDAVQKKILWDNASRLYQLPAA